MRFDGKVAIVTGAAHGMGASHALGFAREGASVVALDIARDIPGISYAMGIKDELDQVVNEIRGMGCKAIGIRTDVTKSAEVKAAVDKTITEFGRIDIIVNNAGVGCDGPLINMSEKAIDAVIDVNIKGVLYCCMHVIPHMARQRYGKIINIASCAALYAEPIFSVYGATKYAVRGLTESLAAEVCHYNINVNAICPGGVFTTLVKGKALERFPDMDPHDAFISEFTNANFFRREITAQDVTNAVLFLASDEARNITSHMLPVSAAVEKKTPAPEPYFKV